MEVSVKIRVYYEDTDMGGIVYYANYLKFCERERSERFFQKGLEPLTNEGHFVVKSLHANYIASAKLGDVLEVSAKLIEIKAASFSLYQEVVKEGQKLFEMDVTLAHIGFDGKLKKISKEHKALILELFGEDE